MKLLFIGLDGLSFDLFEEFEMPFLHDLAEQGVRGRLISFEGDLMCTGPVWASVQTGLHPEGHGVSGTSAGNWHTAAFGKGVKTIWRRLNERGVRCGVVNFPVTYPVRPVDGYLVAGFPAPWGHEGTRDPWERVDRQGELFWPEAIADRIGTFRSAWMNYVTPDQFEDTHTPYQQALEGEVEALRCFMALLYRSLHETARLSHDLIAEREVDLAASVFMETDAVGHLGSALSALQREAFLREADDVARDLFAAAEPENVIVMSDHGCWGKSHTRKGIFLAAGPAFASVDEAKVEVLEVAPTILYLFGVYDAALPAEPAYHVLASGQLGEGEKAQVRERLRAMGYMD